MRVSTNLTHRVWISALVFVLVAHPALASPQGQDTAQVGGPLFGPFEQLRRQAHATCIEYLQSGGVRAFFQCLQQVAFFQCSVPQLDFQTFVWCNAAATTPYPAPGPRVLTARSYRVEIAGGWERERDVQTGAVLSERRITPTVVYTLERQPNGLYLLTEPTGQLQYLVNDRCEILDAGGQPTVDFVPCPVFPDKPYVVMLVSPAQQGRPPHVVTLTSGRLADDLDADGIVEIGYVHTSGSGGRTFTSGNVLAFGYDPDTRGLKFRYILVVRESDNPYTTYAVESLVLYRGQRSP